MCKFGLKLLLDKKYIYKLRLSDCISGALKTHCFLARECPYILMDIVGLEWPELILTKAACVLIAF